MKINNPSLSFNFTLYFLKNEDSRSKFLSRNIRFKLILSLWCPTMHACHDNWASPSWQFCQPFWALAIILWPLNNYCVQKEIISHKLLNYCCYKKIIQHFQVVPFIQLKFIVHPPSRWLLSKNNDVTKLI